MIDRVRQVVADVLGVPLADVRPDSSRESLMGWDSAANVQLMMALEGEFGVALSIDEAVELSSVVKAVELLRSKGAK